MATNLPYQQQDPWALPTMDQYLQQQQVGNQNPVFNNPADNGYVQQDMAVAPAPGIPLQSPDYAAEESLPEDAFARPYSDEEMVNPRNLLWAGILSDLGNYVGSGGRQPMGQTGLKMMMQGHQYNNRLKGANKAAERQHEASQRANEQLKLQQATAARQQLTFDQGQADREALLATGAVPGASADYNAWMQAGQPGTYEQWVRRARAANMPASLQELRAYQAMDDEGKREFMLMKRGAQVGDVEGIPYVVQPDGSFQVPALKGEGSPKSFTDWAELQEYIIDGKRTAEDTAALKVDQIEAFDQAAGNLGNMRVQVEDMREMVKAIDAGRYGKTGFIEGRLQKYNDPETAIIEMRSILGALTKLSETNLAPVSNHEIQMMQSLYADVLSDPKVNKAKLQELIRMSDKAISSIEKQAEYLKKNGDLLNYNRDRALPKTEAGVPDLLRQPTSTAPQVPSTITIDLSFPGPVQSSVEGVTYD